MENHQPVKGYGKGFVASNPLTELAAYDDLPAPARRALDAAPMAFSAVEALDVYKRLGIMALMREIKESEDQAYVAYEAETGVPRPTGELKRRKVRRAFA